MRETRKKWKRRDNGRQYTFYREITPLIIGNLYRNCGGKCR
jgi:hypothetical protein